jgi:hypothetical protein
MVRSNRVDRYFITGLPPSVDNPGIFESRAEAEDWLRAQVDLLADLQRHKLRRLRPCLCCRAEFESEGPHNRMCDVCRRRSAVDGDAHPYSFGALTGRRKSA